MRRQAARSPSLLEKDKWGNWINRARLHLRTTQNLSHDQLQALSDEVGEHRSLLVICTAFRGKPDRYSNLTIKKITKAVLARCEWGKDDYSLQVENLPKAPARPDGVDFTVKKTQEIMLEDFRDHLAAGDHREDRSQAPCRAGRGEGSSKEFFSL